jgi:hypothetical protein
MWTKKWGRFLTCFDMSAHDEGAHHNVAAELR